MTSGTMETTVPMDVNATIKQDSKVTIIIRIRNGTHYAARD